MRCLKVQKQLGYGIYQDSSRCPWLQVDDDVYLHLQHLRLATQQWRAMQAGEALSMPSILKSA